MMKVTVPFYNGDFLLAVHDRKRNKLRLNEVETKGGSACVIAQCIGIWIVGDNFGCTWNARRILLTPPPPVSVC